MDMDRLLELCGLKDNGPSLAHDLIGSPAEYLARLFEPRTRRYENPGHLAARLDPKHGQTAALDAIDDALVTLIDGDEYDALAVYMAPQEGKSQKCARRLPEWLLDHDPSLRIAIVSYEMDTALRWGRDIKQDIALHRCPGVRTDGMECREACGGLHITLRHDSLAAARWETPQGGGVYCVGVGGPLTGRPVDVLIIDDPVKDRMAAESKTMRDAAWDWWESVALTRLAPGAKVILVQTRWHEDDLGGRIESRPSPLTWKVLKIPAIAGENDELGRRKGEEMPSVRGRARGYFHKLKATMSAYVFAGVYQQTPSAPEGNFFRRQTFRYWRHAEPWSDGRERIDLEGKPVTMVDTWRFITMDFAASTKTEADYTVASVWALTLEGDLVLLDRIRAHIPDHDHFSAVQPLMTKWDVGQLWAEANWWSSTFVSDARNAGWSVGLLKADTDKITRAIPAAGRVHSGKVYWPAQAEWLEEWESELLTFPKATHDDQVDTLSYAARIVVQEWSPGTDLPRPGLSPSEQAINNAAAAATGYTGSAPGQDLNIMNIPY